jgi:hypothetical protein
MTCLETQLTLIGCDSRASKESPNEFGTFFATMFCECINGKQFPGGVMTKDALNDRRQALEDEFFHRVDDKLLSEMKAKSTAETNRMQLQTATGISDVDLLDELAAAGATAESLAAISLAPLVLVAWADGKMGAEEREQILKTAKDEGIASDSPAAMLLGHWLTAKPKRELESTWKHYIVAVMRQMGVESQTVLRTEIIGRARAVANASGGILGFGKISADEKRVIAELEEALTI